jgi:tetratricopeptide (TPR) repeat protein
MRVASFTPPDLCPPHEYFQAVKHSPSYPILLSGYSWEVVIRHVTDLFNVVDVSFLTTGSPEAANTLFDLSQTLEDLGMHHYSYTVATWAQVLRRDLYNSDKDMHRRDLASSYCLKARVLGGLGRTNAAIAAAHEAVRLCYEDQALQGVQLAKVLYIQAPLLNAVGRKAEAKVVAKEMVSILGALGEDKPHLKRFLSLAQAFLSDILLDMKEYDEALARAQDGINSARALIGVVDSRPALSIALLIKARVLAARREKSSAYISAVHAVRHLRDLTSERPTFTTFLAHALVLSSRYLHAAGFYWEARKGAEEAVQVHQTLHTFASQTFAAHYAEALGQLVRLRVAPDGTLMTSRRRRRRRSEEQEQEDEEDDDDDEAAEVFDMAQHAAGLFRETTIRDSEALADVLLVIANTLFDESRAQEAAPNAEEAVGILRPRWKRSAEEYAPRFVRALGLAAACRPESEAGLEYAKEAVEAHRPRRDLDQATHEQILTHLLMDVFSRLKEMGREVEAIPWKTEAARLNVDVVESMDPPAPGADYHKGLLGGTMEYPEGSEDEAEDI